MPYLPASEDPVCLSLYHVLAAIPTALVVANRLVPVVHKAGLVVKVVVVAAAVQANLAAAAAVVASCIVVGVSVVDTEAAGTAADTGAAAAL